MQRGKSIGICEHPGDIALEFAELGAAEPAQVAVEGPGCDRRQPVGEEPAQQIGAKVGASLANHHDQIRGMDIRPFDW